MMNAPKPTILVVEDETITAMALRETLTQMGYNVGATVPTGEAAVERARALKPDAVLMDIRLKGKMDGITAADIIRRETGAPVVYLTAYSDTDTLRRAKVTEPYGYIVKPYNENELRAILEIAIHKGAMERANRARAEEISENVLQSIADVNPAIIYLKRGDGRFMLVNRRFEEVFGLPRERARGTADNAVLPQALAEADERALRDGQTSTARETVDIPGGSRTFMAVRLPLTRGDGTVYGLCTILTDVAEPNADETKALRALGAALAGQVQRPAAPAQGPTGAAEALAMSHADMSAEARQLAGNVRRMLGSILGAPSRTDAGTIDITKIAREVAKDVVGREPSRRIDVKVDDGLRARGDPVLLRAVLGHLLDNAVKFTAARSDARIHVGRGPAGHHGEQVFFVQDNGEGFDPSQADRLFQPFERLTTAGGKSGAGLGLSAVRNLIEGHSGRVWAEGQPGKGATFYFALPE